jgi:hypothetical protein
MEKNAITRRKFVKGIAGVTVCYTCFSFDGLSAVEWDKTREDIGKEYLASVCGTYCGACPAYIAKHSTDEELKLRRAKRVTTESAKPGKSIPNPHWMDSILCDGCLSGGQIAAHCKSCAMKTCAESKQNVTRCSDCSDLPCNRVTVMINTGLLHRAEYLPNLDKIRKMGAREWVKLEEERWRCTKCGLPMSWYDAGCVRCGEPRSEKLFPLV